MSDVAAQHASEVSAGQRFKFGENWARFLGILNDNRILQAEQSLTEMLGVPLQGKTFIDVGSGSGLFSLAARRLGAYVYSFDYDSQSVACTMELKRRYFPEDSSWTVAQGSALDREYLAGLGQFEIVYSWGVLHHTGAMWDALDHVSGLVAEGGLLFVAIYNDQGKKSQRWKKLKQIYTRSSKPIQLVLALTVCVASWWRRWLKDFLRLHPFETWRHVGRERGMSAWLDVVDWVGGYPFEVAKPEQIFSFYHNRGFILERLQTDGGGLGCNQFVFSKPKAT
jgi:2-polyprenyl-3-methyl-5-hydroxy-6-metoxy-1,4-benzoquinol methylase